jgi:hypothetical protein
MRIILSLGLMIGWLIGSASWAAAPTADQCAALAASIHHHPSPDVAYRPDPDVVPAEIKPQPDAIAPHDPIKMDLKSTTGFPGSPTQPARQANYGQITIDIAEDGNARVLLNGRAVDDDTSAQLLAACAKK